MNGLALQEKIARSRALAAERAGQLYRVYRPAGADFPLHDFNVVAEELPCAFSNKGDFVRPVEFGQAAWLCYHDARRTQVGDYLAGPLGTFFVASQAGLMTPLVVRCNRRMQLLRPEQPTGTGAVGYGGDTVAAELVLAREWPVACLEGGKGEENITHLPLDVKNPGWRIFWPAIPGVNIRLSDVLVDEQGNRYFVNSAELSPLGWRLKAVLRQA